MKKITLTEALREIKTLDSRIQKASSETMIACTKVDGGVVVHPRTTMPKTEMGEYISSAYQSVNDLIEYRAKLKSALIEANSTITVTINNKEMTIASAIEQKNSIGLKENLLRNLSMQYTNAVRVVDQAEEAINAKFDSAVDNMLGGKESKSKDDDFSVIRTQFEKQLKLELINPIDIEGKIKSLQDDIQKFLDEVDVALSIANATNHIEV